MVLSYTSEVGGRGGGRQSLNIPLPVPFTANSCEPLLASCVGDHNSSEKHNNCSLCYSVCSSGISRDAFFLTDEVELEQS